MTQMKVITNIEYVIVDSNNYVYEKLKKPYHIGKMFNVDGRMCPHEYEITQEQIRGQHLISPNGNEVVLGFTNDVCEHLEFPLNCFQDLNNKINILTQDYSLLVRDITKEHKLTDYWAKKYHKTKTKIDSANWIKRLKYLFTRGLK